jgi:hypothetical protein
MAATIAGQPSWAVGWRGRQPVISANRLFTTRWDLVIIANSGGSFGTGGTVSPRS